METETNTETKKQDILTEFNEKHFDIWRRKTASRNWILLPPLTAEEHEEVKVFSRKSAQKKVKETGHEEDYEQEYWRAHNGKYAEWSFRKQINFPPPDLTIGESHKYVGEDIIIEEEKFGIKCSKVGQAALVFKKPTLPEIILIMHGNDVYLCGIASVKIMKECHDELLKKSARNQKKAGLTIEGYENLYPFSNTYEYLKRQHVTSKITGKSIKTTCDALSALLEKEESLSALLEKEEFVNFYNKNYKTAKKALKK